MCDIIKHDKDNFQIDGEMFSVIDLESVADWQDVRNLIGSEKASQMREFDFNPNEIIRYMEKVAH